jgi:D-alanine-D-alanine ligase-like ATP-grasp enzyme/ribosomal protein S18 acetylase RimI-like enzyme
MRVAILHHAVTDEHAPDERDVLDQAASVGDALAELGHTWERLPCTLDLARVADRLREDQPDLVFNLVESLAGTGRLIHLVPALLDAMAVAYTGSCTEAIAASSHKLMAKDRLAAAGLPTPPWIGPLPPDLPPVARRPSGSDDSAARWLVKSLWEHASVGLDENAAVLCKGAAGVTDALRNRAGGAAGACFAEKYVDGREFNLSLLAAPGRPEVLKPAEITFEGYPPEALRIVGYRAKWDPESYEYQHTLRRFDFPEDDAALLSRLKELAVRCWELFGLNGYARVDFRVDDSGNPWILEINTNPCLSPDAGFAAALQASGIGFTEAIRRILEDARRSTPLNAPAPCAADPAPIRQSASRPPAGIQLRRSVEPSDRGRVRHIAGATGFFHPGEVDVAEELVSERLENGPASGYEFVFAEVNGGLAGYTCYGPVPMTVSSYDLYWIVVSPKAQQRGVGRLLLTETERLIRLAGGTRLYAETSGRALYASTHAFYRRTGFTMESRLNDYYAPGDDKIIFSKLI